MQSFQVSQRVNERQLVNELETGNQIAKFSCFPCNHHHLNLSWAGWWGVCGMLALYRLKYWLCESISIFMTLLGTIEEFQLLSCGFQFPISSRLIDCRAIKFYSFLCKWNPKWMMLCGQNCSHLQLLRFIRVSTWLLLSHRHALIDLFRNRN